MLCLGSGNSSCRGYCTISLISTLPWCESQHLTSYLLSLPLCSTITASSCPNRYVQMPQQRNSPAESKWGSRAVQIAGEATTELILYTRHSAICREFAKKKNLGLKKSEKQHMLPVNSKRFPIATDIFLISVMNVYKFMFVSLWQFASIKIYYFVWSYDFFS